MRSFVCALLVVCFCFGQNLFAQCENGQCRITPVRDAASAVVQVQPVRSAVHGVQQSVSNVRASVLASELARTGQMYHDPFAGRENIFYSSNTAFPRIQARSAWRQSPGHRANLPMVGLRVARGPSGVYVVGR